MNTQTQASAAEEVDQLARKYEDSQGLSYSDALKKVAHEKPALWRRYAGGDAEEDCIDKEGAAEFSQRVVAYTEHFRVDKSTAEKMVRKHDPKMQKFYTHGGEVMSNEKVPLSAESVVDFRAQEKMRGGVESYQEAVAAVLADDPQLALCYDKSLPYVEGDSAARTDSPMTGPSQKAVLGNLIVGAKNSDGSIDIPLALRVASLAPNIVMGAAGERLTEIANRLIDTLGLTGMRSERFPETLRQAEREHPELVSAMNTGKLDETGFREIFWTWFSRDRD